MAEIAHERFPEPGRWAVVDLESQISVPDLCDPDNEAYEWFDAELRRLRRESEQLIVEWDEEFAGYGGVALTSYGLHYWYGGSSGNSALSGDVVRLDALASARPR